MQLIGKIIKLNRIQENIKQVYIVDSLEFSNSYYSRVENNVNILDEERTKEIFELMNIEYTGEDIEEEFEKVFYEYNKKFSYYEDYNPAYEKIESYYPRIRSTTSYPKYLLAKMIYLIKIRENFDIADYFFLEDYFEYLDSYHIQLYYDMIGNYYVNKEDFKKSLEYFNKALNQRGNPLTTSMLFYHVSMTYVSLGRFSDSLRYLEEAKQYFVKSLNIKRYLMVEFLIGLVNQNMNNVEYGLKKYFECLEAFKILKMKRQIHNTYNSILWTYMKDGQYENVLKIKDEALNEISDDAYFYFMIAYTYYKMNDIENAKNYIQQAQSFLHLCDDDFKITIIKALYTLLYDNNEKHRETVLIKVYQAAIKCQDQEVEQFSLHMLCDYYRKQQHIDKVNHYMKLLIDCHNRLE